MGAGTTKDRVIVGSILAALVSLCGYSLYGFYVQITETVMLPRAEWRRYVCKARDYDTRVYMRSLGTDRIVVACIRAHVQDGSTDEAIMQECLFEERSCN